MTEDVVRAVRSGIQEARRNRYAGSGGGRPRVPHDLPRRLAGLESGLRSVASVRTVDHPASDFVAESTALSGSLIDRLTHVCREIQDAAPALVDQLRLQTERLGIRYDAMIEERLRDGLLPFSNADICPVSPYGGMEPWKFGNPPELNAFAQAHLHRYEELDETGSVLMDWTHAIVRAAESIVGREPFRGHLIRPRSAQ